MYRCPILISLGLAYLCCVGCESERKSAPTAAVKGTVRLDGEPMKSGEITFSVPGEPVRVLPITNGTFSGEAFQGKNRVEVNLFTKGPPIENDPSNEPTRINTVAPEFNNNTGLSADVTAGGANDFTIEVTSK